MKRCICALAAVALLVLTMGVATAYADTGQTLSQPTTAVQSATSPVSAPTGGQTQAAGQQASNAATSEQAALVAGAANTQVGGNNSTTQVGGTPRMAVDDTVGIGGANESNNNTNTAGDQTAVNGNNFQQSNDQTITQTQQQRSGDACCKSHTSSDQTQRAYQSARNEGRNKQLSLVAGAENTQVGANNTTTQVGGSNEQNGNTNTVGDQTAVNGNNFQQSNDQTVTQTQRSGGSDLRKDGRDGGIPTALGRSSSSERCGCQPKKHPCGCESGDQSQWAGQRASNTGWNKQLSLVAGAENTQVGANNGTEQLGGAPGYSTDSVIVSGGNESNNNTNTAGDQTAVNGNNFQQSNDQTITQTQRSGSQRLRRDGDAGPPASILSGGDWKPCGCEPKHNPCGCDSGDQSQSAGQWASNTGWNKQGSIVLGGVNTQVGANNNTMQVGGYNESNNNTNTAGDQTAVNGNNYQQSNDQTVTQTQRSGSFDSHGDGGPPVIWSGDHNDSCGCASGDQSQWAGEWASNTGWNKQYSLVLGGINTQVGANNNTMQVGGYNESNNNTNTAGDQTAVNGNNYQQSNDQTTTQRQTSFGGGQDGCGCDEHPRPCGCDHPGSQPCGCDHPKPCGCDHPKPCGCDHPKPCECEHPKPCGCDHPRPCGCDHPKGRPCGCDGRKHDSGDQSQRAYQSASNRGWNKQYSLVLGGINTQVGANNNTMQVGGYNESNNNTNTAGDQTAVNGNNYQQTNDQTITQTQRSGSQLRERVPVA